MGDYDYRNLLKEKIDAIVISTPWRWHCDQAVGSMQAGNIV